MKTTILKPLLLCVGLCLAIRTASFHQKRAEKSLMDNVSKPAVPKSIDEIVIELLKAYPDLKCGIEAVSGINDLIAVPSEPTAGETEAQALTRVSALIAAQTDFECRNDGHWLVVLPRPNKEKFDQPITLRACTAPAGNGIALASFLKMVKAVRPEEPVSLVQDFLLMDKQPRNLIYGKERIAPCYQVLSNVAEQLSARCWRVSHMYPVKDGSPREIVFPIKLDFALVSFHAPGEIRSTR